VKKYDPNKDRNHMIIMHHSKGYRPKANEKKKSRAELRKPFWNRKKVGRKNCARFLNICDKTSGMFECKNATFFRKGWRLRNAPAALQTNYTTG